MSMTPQTVALLDELCRSLGIIVDWSAPDVVTYINQMIEKYIAWEVATSRAWLSVGIVMCVIGAWIVYKDFRTWHDDFPAIFGVVLVIISIWMIGEQINDILACTYWPEKALANYVSWLKFC